jgi:PadR family transcriptional regulator, regulatory protein AphA
MLQRSQTGARTRYLILGLLSEGPKSGYDLAKVTRLRFRFFWSESYGQIYPELRRLSEEGLVVQEGREPGTRGRKTWTITSAGRTALGSWLEDPECSNTARLETVLKAYFAFAAPGSLGKTLDAFSSSLESDLAALEEMSRELRSIPDPHRNHQYAIMTVELGLATYRAWTEWASRWASKGL